MKQLMYDFFIGGSIALFASLLIKYLNNHSEPLNIFCVFMGGTYIIICTYLYIL